MELNAKPTETDIVLVHDKILMALLAANGVMGSHTFSTGWPDDPSEVEREVYVAYEHTSQVKHLIKSFEAREITVNLDDYLSAADELENYVGKITYMPTMQEGAKDE